MELNLINMTYFADSSNCILLTATLGIVTICLKIFTLVSEIQSQRFLTVLFMQFERGVTFDAQL